MQHRHAYTRREEPHQAPVKGNNTHVITTQEQKLPQPSQLSYLRNQLSRPGVAVAVFRALYLGDMLVAIPALRTLKRFNPDMHLTLIGLAWAREFAARYDFIDAFAAVPPLPGLHTEPVEDASAREALESLKRRFDVVIQMHGSGPQSNDVVRSLEPRASAGFFPALGTVPGGGAYIPYPETGSEVSRSLVLVEALTGARGTDELEFPITEDDRLALDTALQSAGGPLGRYVCVHPGAKLSSRRWPLDRFATVAGALRDEGRRIVVTGSQAEAGLTAPIVSAIGASAVDMTGRTSLGALAALIEGADLLVSNDTGVAHLAAAARTPSVIVSSGSDAARWAPGDTRLHRTLAHNIECRPCMYEDCPIGHPCALGTTVAAVLAEAEDLLAVSGGGR